MSIKILAKANTTGQRYEVHIPFSNKIQTLTFYWFFFADVADAFAGYRLANGTNAASAT